MSTSVDEHYERHEAQELLAQEVYMFVRRQVGAAIHPIPPEDVRPALALALEALEREGLIPGEAPELREVGEQGALAELRRNLRRIRGDFAKKYETGLFTDGLDRAVQELDRIAAKSTPAAPAADRFKAALRLQGVDLGADAMEAVLRALAAMDEVPA